MKKRFFVSLVAAAMAVAGCIATAPSLSEPVPLPSHRHTYVAQSSASTLTIPVVLWIEDPALKITISGRNMLGTAVPLGSFNCGEIIAREFERVVDANFRRPVGNEPQDATLSVQVLGMAAWQEMNAHDVDASVRLQVKIADLDGKELYCKVFSGSGKDGWYDRKTVPLAVYSAIGNAVESFLSDCQTWQRPIVGIPDSRPGIKGPSLESLTWNSRVDENIQTGSCVIKLNDYDPFKARAWADAQIFALCRSRLGNIEPERVRMVLDVDDYKNDSASNTWKIVFKAFARTPYALNYDPVTNTGFIIGDVELMGFGKDFEGASKKLTDIVYEKMVSYGGPVSKKIRENEVLIRFGKFETNEMYNLITIAFKLVYY